MFSNAFSVHIAVKHGDTFLTLCSTCAFKCAIVMTTKS
jgi:hypothetical protein